MANKNLTIFQRLGKVIGPESVKQTTPQTTQRYNIGNGELIKTDNKADYERAKLQAQQNKYLGQTWKKVESGLFQQAINYETTRIGSYSDFEAMEFYPTIAAALDVMMEESTTVNDNGRIINIYSDSKRVKTILEDLFFNRLDLHTSLPMWTRNTCKYGDNFVYLNINDKQGVVGGKQMPNYEMERREGGLFDVISGRELTDQDADLNRVKFFWRGRDVEFNSWQIAHFRLLGDDRRLPYGTCLKGDTRVNTEFGVEEISKIELGTKVWSFNTKTQEKELSPILDKIMSGTKEVFKISTRHNYVDASKEHRILVALKSGEFIYKNVNELKLGDLLVINQKEKTNKLIKIDKTAPITNKNGWFNNINLIPDFVNEEIAQLFGFLIGDGWIPKHNNSVDFALGVDEETNKFYIDLLEKYSGVKIIRDNKQVKCNSKLLKTILERLDFNGKSYEKRIPKWVFEMEPDLQKAFVSGLIDADGWITKDKWTIAIHIELNNKPLIEDLKILLQRIGYKSGSIRTRIRKTPIIDGRQIKNVKESHMITFFDKNLNQMIIHDVNGRLNYDYVLEPIQSIESIGEFETYDIYVENKNHNFYANNIVVHNSVLEKARRIWKQLILSEDSMLVYRVTRAPERRVYKIYVGNIDDGDVEAYVNTIADRFKRMPITDPQTGQIDLRYNQLSNDQDFFIPVRSEDAPNPIDTLPGASNLDQIADIEYLQRNLFTALRVPKPFLGFEDTAGEGKNLALQDIRFSRTINRIQQSMLQELNKIAIIHLYLLGFEDDLDNFTLTLNNPSTQAEMLKVEHMQQKVTLLKDAVSDIGNGFGVMSWTRAHREIMGWSDDEIKQDLLEQRMEKAASAELQNTANVIKHTGMFDTVDRIYGDFKVALAGGGGGAEGGEGGEAGGGGGLGGSFGGGGGDIGGEDLDFGDTEVEGGETPEAGAEGGETPEAEGGAEPEVAEPSVEPVAEALRKKENLLKEEKKVLADKLQKRTDKYQSKFVNVLVESVKPEDRNKTEKVKIYDKNIKINEGIDSMINDINKMLDE
jgi:intein/homing endonuclease